MIKIEEEKWTKHYEKLYEDNEKKSNDEEIRINENLERIKAAPTQEDVERYIKKMKNMKAAGYDGLVAELIKYGGKELHKRIDELIEEVWFKEEMLREWKIGVIIPIAKQEDMVNCENYRAITMLNVAYKIVTAIVNDRLTRQTETIIIEQYQYGFRERKAYYS
ncbi:hypothetical protein Zmor_013793 [Zophobas morio]|uniref:Reverse transcriptase domain-containing protein n=1 Tax=Zophobas morio TaxID=2755281 RepID=A0AA38IG44_9CUCU|nr:hypothetical protein Zmor_013793 [Zophobas morio]